MRKNKLTRVAVILGIVAGMMMLLLLAYFGITENIEVFSGRHNTGYREFKDYTYREIQDEKATIGIKKEYSWRLTETPKGDTCLAFYVVHQYVEVFIDGKVVYSLMPSEQKQIGKTTGSNWVIIPLYPEDEGKEICVVTEPVYKNYQNRTIDFLIGSQLQIYLNQLKSDLPQLIVSVLAVLAGLFFGVLGIHSYWKKRDGSNLISLGIFSAMMGIWRFTDTRSTPLIFPEKPVMLFYISLAMLMLGMIPLMKSMQKRFSEKIRKLFDCSIILASVICMVQLLLQIFGVTDFRETLSLTHILILINVAVIVGSVLYERIRYGEKETTHIGKNFSIICGAGVILDIIAFYVKGSSSGLIFTLSAFMIYNICTGIAMLMDYKEQERKLKEQEEALASSRIDILLSQIQPHFIYNSLIAITSLCQSDPKEAENALDHFSKYLRGSMDSLTEKKCVSFEKELEHVKNYLYMEKKRFGDRLQVIYDIKEKDFLLPALTVQPMVENAVRHGICKKKEGGWVMISSYADAENWIVEVKDNGKGFDTAAQNSMDGVHVGIESVRSRLEMMCNGRLTITSSPANGTKVLIQIPKYDTLIRKKTKKDKKRQKRQ